MFEHWKKLFLDVLFVCNVHLTARKSKYSHTRKSSAHVLGGVAAWLPNDDIIVLLA